MNSEQDKEEIIKILKDVPCMSLATIHKTSSGKLKSRNIGLAFAFDDTCTIYWVSRIDSDHSKDILVEPDISIVIFDSKAPQGARKGINIEALAYEVHDHEEIEKTSQLFHKQTGNPKRDLALRIGNATRRVYKTVPYEIRTNYWYLSETGDIMDDKIFLSLP
jgi:general stress protein 26